MIRLNVQEVAKRKGVTNAYQLAIRAEIAHSKAARLWNGSEELPKLETLDALCGKLKCRLSDLITWIPGEPETRKSRPARNGTGKPVKRK